MTFDLWTHQYCLACDKQVQVDGAAYCSEACRLAEFEKTSATSSQPTSPGLMAPSRASSARPSQSRFYLSPAYDFTNAQPYGSTPARKSLFEYYTKPAVQSQPAPARQLTPSSSHSSLCSMQSTSSAGDVSDKAKKELQAYAVSFEQVRMQRRRSY